MSKLQKIISSIFSILLLIGIGFGIYKYTDWTKQEQTTSKPEIVKVGYQKLAASLAIYSMIERKIDAKYNFKVELTELPTSTQGINGLLNNSVDVSYGQGVDPGLEAMAKDSGKIKLLNYSDENDTNPWNAIIIPQKSQINSIKNLEGKKVLVQAGGTAEKKFRYYLTKQKVDVNKIEFVPLAYNKHIEVLTANQADAAFTYEPNITIGIEKYNLKVLDKGIFAKIGVKHTSGSFISTDFIAKTPDLAKRFTQALDESISFVDNNETESRKYLQKYLSIEENLAQKLILFRMVKSNEVTEKGLQEYIDRSLEIGSLSKRLDAKDLIMKI